MASGWRSSLPPLGPSGGPRAPVADGEHQDPQRTGAKPGQPDGSYYEIFRQRYLRKGAGPSQSLERLIHFGGARAEQANNRFAFPSNSVSTTKYEWWNIVPKNILEQFRRTANFWFLVVSVLQLAPLDLSPTTPTATLVPLCAVLFATFCKDAYEDHRRARDDNRLNCQLCDVLDQDGEFRQVFWKDLTVGEYVRLTRDQPVPCDMILLACSGDGAAAYVDTAQLDGETSLKPKDPLEETMRISQAAELLALEGHAKTEPPNQLLQSFSGMLVLRGHPRPAAVDARHFLLRGSTLRNTDWAYGLTVFTGHDTKLVQNLKRAPSKRSRVEVTSNALLVIVFGLLVLASAVSTATRAVHLAEGTEGDRRRSWVWPEEDSLRDNSWVALVTFMILYNNLIPISLYVTADLVRSLQGLMMELDGSMYHEGTDSHCSVRNSSLNEDLGQVEFVLTDKTGTLTENHMQFKAASIGGRIYGYWDEALGPVDYVAAVPPLPVCVPLDGRLLARARGPPPAAAAAARACAPESSEVEGLIADFFLCLATCHSAIVELAPGESSRRPSAQGSGPEPSRSTSSFAGVVPRVGDDAPPPPPPVQGDATPRAHHASPLGLLLARRSPTPSLSVGSGKSASSVGARQNLGPELATEAMARLYRSPSPDEEALVAAARDFGFYFRRKVGSRITVNVNGEDQHYSVLLFNDFTSERKRMSVLVRRTSEDASPEEMPSLFGPLWNGSGDDDGDGGPEDEPMSPLPAQSRAAAGRLSPEEEAGSLPDGLGSGREVPPAVLYSKGADNVMLERLSARGAEQAESDAFKGHLSQFTSKGFRTLILGKRLMSGEEVSRYLMKMEEAKGAFMNRDGMLESVADEMERGFDLLGITAIEDRIQQGVPETVDLLRRAGIKVWMLTGDNMETATNIAVACKLIDSSVKTYRLALPGAKHDLGRVRQTLEDLYAEVRQQLRTGGEFGYCLIVHGSMLYAIMDDPCLRQLFLEVACSSRGVVACRLAPAQKAQLVGLVRRGVQGDPLTLAIGDGGNDVAMIQEAHVGVGILGSEGRQAANAADFTIGRFCFLQRLLLVHGRWNLRRISLVMGYFFYKNFFLVVPMMMYGPSVGFSGTTLYESHLLATFNLVFTCLPIIVAGVFDWDVSAQMALLVPSLYQLGMRGHYFNPLVLVGWIAKGTLHAILTTSCMLLLFSGASSGGESPDVFVMGSWAYGTCVIVANATLLLHTKSWMDWQLLIMAGSSLAFVPAIACFSEGVLFLGALEPRMHGVAGGLFAPPRHWLAMLLAVAACVASDAAACLVRRFLRPSAADVLQEVERHRLPGATDPARGPSGAAPAAEAENVVDALRRIPAPPARALRVRPEGRLSLRPLRARSGSGGRRLPRRKRRTTAPAPDEDSCGIWDELPESPAQSAGLRALHRLGGLLERRWAEMDVEEVLGCLSLERFELPGRSMGRGETLALVSPRVEMPKHLKLAISIASTTPSSITAGDKRTSDDTKSIGVNAALVERNSTTSSISQDSGGQHGSSASGAGGPLYSVLTLRFRSEAQEAAFRTLLERRALPLFRFFCACCASTCAAYNLIQLVLEPREGRWAAFLVVSMFCLTIPVACMSPRLFTSCGQRFEQLIVILLMFSLVFKHLYDYAADNTGALFNTYVPMFIVAFARIRFINLALVLCFHLTLIVIFYLFLAEDGVLDLEGISSGIGAEYLVLMLGTVGLALYYCYQHEVLMRKDWFILDTMAHSRHEGLEILKGMFPEEVVNHVLFKIGGRGMFSQKLLKDRVASVLFLDIMDFDDLVGVLAPEALVRLLDQVWSLLDRLCERSGVAKIETVGKTYMAAALPDGPAEPASGPAQQARDAVRVVTTAISMLEERARRFIGSSEDGGAAQVSVRIGAHTGRVLSGVVGAWKPQFALFGDTVNTASRMQSTGVRNGLHVSSATWELLQHDTRMEWEARKTQVKGKGLMDTYLLKRYSRKGLKLAKSASTCSRGTARSELVKSASTCSRGTAGTAASFHDFKVSPSSRKTSVSSLLSSLPPVRVPSILSDLNPASPRSLGDPAGHWDADEEDEEEEEEEEEGARGTAGAPDAPELLHWAQLRGRSRTRGLEERSCPWRHARSLAWLARGLLCPHWGQGQLGSSMMAQWVTFVGFLACLAAESLVLLGGGGAAAEEWLLRAGYLVCGAVASAALWCAGRAYGWGMTREHFLNATAVPSFFSAVIAMSVFAGFVCSAIASLSRRDRLGEEDSFCIFESFFFVVVLMLLCRLHPQGTAPAGLGLVVCVFILSYAAMSGTGQLLECVTYFLLLSGTHVVAVWTDPRTGFSQYKRICKEHEQIQELVDSMLPREVLSEMKCNKLSLAYNYENMTFLFADIVGFTRYCSEHTAEQAVNLVTQLFAVFDEEAKRKGVYKVCTIGDAYVVVDEPRRTKRLPMADDAAMAWKGMPVFEMGKAMLAIIKRVREREEVQNENLDMRIGIHYGKFVGGVIGTKRLRFDIWGHDVLMGNSVESHGKAGCICVSEPVRNVLERAAAAGVEAAVGLRFEHHDDVVLKSGGAAMRTYLCTDGAASSGGGERPGSREQRPAGAQGSPAPASGVPPAPPAAGARVERPVDAEPLL